jgi:hypothetical protein
MFSMEPTLSLPELFWGSQLFLVAYRASLALPGAAIELPLQRLLSINEIGFINLDWFLNNGCRGPLCSGKP